ncbi:MAG: hypothetical protein Q9211_001170 [Gyalolechia sp. 1 TL-2023]
MQSESNLHRLPAELIDQIIKDLDINSIRLVCKALHNHTFTSFKRLFANQKTNLTSKSLERLFQIANHPQLGTAVQSLTVLTPILDASELDRINTIKRSLIRAQEGNLDSVTIEPPVWRRHYPPYTPAQLTFGWERAWVRTARVYRVVTQAIAYSGVIVAALHIYRDSQQWSIATWDIDPHIPTFEGANLGRAAVSIKNISLGVSTNAETDDEPIERNRIELSGVDRAFYEDGLTRYIHWVPSNEAPTVAEENYPGVARLLKQMPNLERLDLRLYRRLGNHPTSYVKLFSYIVNEVVLRSLRHCTLQGIYVNELLLLTFLRTHPGLETLQLREVHLLSGSWEKIFAHFCAMPSLQEVTLQNIWAPGLRLISLAPKHLPTISVDDDNPTAYQCSDGIMMHTRTFSQEEISREKFEFAKGPGKRPMQSPAFSRWVASRALEYGAL